MSTLKTLAFLSFLAFASQLLGQAVTKAKLSCAEAIKVASHLTVGMKQAEVRKVLERSGFGKETGAISMHSAIIQHDLLANGCALRLEYRPSMDSTNVLVVIATSQLQQASILSNGVQLFSISLTNAP
jgi:hypothetical protein